jgi:transcriptional regulator with XRE-family HTH domain
VLLFNETMRTELADDFATLLRGRRSRSGLSQLELAVRTGTTQRHISFLERGRSKPGRDIVLRLADSLNSTLRQRNALLMAAGFAPAHPESPRNSADFAPILSAVQHVLDGHRPYPAMMMAGHGEVVASNRSFGFMLDLVSPELLTPPVNALRIALHPDGMAPHILNLEQWRHHILGGLRSRDPDPALEALIEELEGYGVPSRASASEQAVPFAVPLHLRTGLGDVRLLATLATFLNATDVTLADLRLEAFLPADRESADILYQYDRAQDARNGSSGGARTEGSG